MKHFLFIVFFVLLQLNDASGQEPNSPSPKLPLAETESVELYFDAGLSVSHICNTVPGMVTVRVVAENFSVPITAIQFMISSPPGLIYMSDVVPPPFISFGNSQTGIMIGFMGSEDASDQLHVLTVNYFDPSGCSDCLGLSNHISVVPDPAEPSGEIVAVDDLSQPIYADGSTSSACGEPPSIYYVDATATGANTGFSWANAFTDLQDALALSPPQIMVAAGTYIPTSGTDRTATFELYDGLNIFGGYPSGGGTRDISANQTVLSGEIGSPGNSDNSYHVVTDSNLSVNTVLDGFTILSGNAASASYPHNNGGGMRIIDGFSTISNVIFTANLADSGGGLYNNGGSPTLANVTFNSNIAYDGGGMFNIDGNPVLTNVDFVSDSAYAGGGFFNERGAPTFHTCLFDSNRAGTGGGMYNQGNPSLTGVTFSINQAQNMGGGFYNYGGNPSLDSVVFDTNRSVNYGGGFYNRDSTATINNSTFRGNYSALGGGLASVNGSVSMTSILFELNTAGDGGGLYASGSSGSQLLSNIVFSENSVTNFGGGLLNTNACSPSITNCTFWHNQANTGGGMYNLSGSNPVIINTIMWADSAGTFSEIHNSSSTPTISYSLIEDCGGDFEWDSGLGINGGNNIDSDPLLVDAANGDLSPGLGSLAIDTGDSNAVYLPAYDFDGKLRIIGPTVDIGAFEALYSPDAPRVIVYFNEELTHSDICVDASIVVFARVVAENFPNNIQTLQFKIETPPGLTYVGESSPYIVMGFNSQSGVEILFGGALDASDQLQVMTITYLSNTACADCLSPSEPVVVVPDPAARYNAILAFDEFSHFLAARGDSSWTCGGVPLVKYVDHSAMGADNGFTWADAFTDLQTALSTPSIEIRVATGTYKPTLGADRTATFQLPDGVAIYGGYPAGGDTVRDVTANTTVLSGEVGGPGDSDNSYHVVTDSGSSSNTALDGFTITAGNAASATYPHNNGGGMWVINGNSNISNVVFTANNADSGGGLYNNGGSPTLSNVTFSSNTAANGGGMYNIDGNPSLTNAVFIGDSALSGGGFFNERGTPSFSGGLFSVNIADTNGGGMFNRDNPSMTGMTFVNNWSQNGGGIYNINGSPSISSTVFTNNTATIRGGGFYNMNGNATVTSTLFELNTAINGGGMYSRGSGGYPILINTIFAENRATIAGGGLFNNYSCPTELINCTFWKNMAEQGGGIANREDSHPVLVNTIMWADTATVSAPEIYNNLTEPVISFSLIEGSGGSGAGWDVSLGIDNENNIDADPLFADTTDGHFPLSAGSPAIDTGNNTVSNLPENDYEGNPRLTGLTVDIGAYESTLIENNSPRLLVYFDSALKQRNGCVTATIVYARVVAENFNEPLVGFGFKVSTSQYLTYLSESHTADLAIGDSEIGTSLAYLQPQDASDQFLLTTITYLYTQGSCADCGIPSEPVIVVPDPAAGSGSIEAYNSDYILITAVSDTSFACGPALQGFNLEVAELDAPAELFTGDSLGTDVTVTITNTGLDSVVSDSFAVSLYLSYDETITFADELVGSVSDLYNLAVDDTFLVNIPGATTIPGSSPRGDMFLGVILDSGYELVETDESDNTESKSVIIDPDQDVDGVPNNVDVCMATDSSPFDHNGDGCVDEISCSRNIEYWDLDDFPFTYVIYEDGAPGIGDGSDITAVQNGVAAWASIPGCTITVNYAGLTAQNDAQSLDGVNLVTFGDSDPEFVFPAGVLAVGITTSFTEPTLFNGQMYRPGQIADADMIFSPYRNFSTPTAGTGTDIESISIHEAGHLFGVSHSAIRSATMFYVLPPGTTATSFELDDRLAILRAYPTSATLSNSNRLKGTVTNGYTGQPVPGAIVYVIAVASGDTVASDFTLPETGSFDILGLTDGDYYVAIHPLNGSSAIAYLTPAHINYLMRNTAEILFVPEYYNIGDSTDENPMLRDSVVVAGGSVADISIISNVDDINPSVVDVSPDPDDIDVRIDASILIKFSEPIDIDNISGNFSLTDTLAQQFITGRVSLVKDDSTLAFIPDNTLSFSTIYCLELTTGICDKFGNGLADPYFLYFTTMPKPDVGITSLAPARSVEGAIVVIDGFGIEPNPGDNVVDFNGLTAEIISASPTDLVVKVPPGVTTGPVQVTNTVESKTSNTLIFTVLAADDVARGVETNVLDLGALPRSLTVLPDGNLSFVATKDGYTAIVVDPGSSGFLSNQAFPITNGLNELDASPDGDRVYAISAENEILYRINAVISLGGLNDLYIVNEMNIGSSPRGVLVGPSGRRAYIPTEDNEIQIWDANSASATFDRQIGAIPSSDSDIIGKMAIDASRNYLLVPSSQGKLLVFNLDNDSLLAEIEVGLDPRDVIVDPIGERAYVADSEGNVVIVSLSSLTKINEIRAGGSLRGIAITPTGSFLYMANRILNLIDIIDLRPDSDTFLNVATNIQHRTNPADIVLSPDGIYAYSLSEAEKKFVVTAIGIGPNIRSITPSAAPPGGLVVISGSRFTADAATDVSFFGTTVSPNVRRDSALVVTVPGGAETGPVSVIGINPPNPDVISNEIFFVVLDSTRSDGLRLAASLPSPVDPTHDMSGIMRLSPLRNLGLISTVDGGQTSLHMLDIRLSSPTLHKYIGSIPIGSTVLEDLTIMPSNHQTILLLDELGTISAPVFDVNPNSQTFLVALDSLNVSSVQSGAAITTNLDGSICLLSDPTQAVLHVFDIASNSPYMYESIGVVPVAGVTNGNVTKMAFHPNNAFAYLAVHDVNNAAVIILDTDPDSPTFLNIANTLPLPGSPPQEVPVSLSFMPNGDRCLVLTAETSDPANRSVLMLNTEIPGNPTVSYEHSLGGSPSGVNHIEVSPRGDRAIVSIQDQGLRHLSIALNRDTLVTVAQAGNSTQDISEFCYVPDASRVYGVIPDRDSLVVYDFQTADSIAIVSGDAQSGVVNEPLQTAIRVKVFDNLDLPVAGIPVSFTLPANNGIFTGTNLTSQVVLTDDLGLAEVYWTLGPTLGIQVADVSSTGLTGSPLQFTATGHQDPTTLALTIVNVNPPDNATGISNTTAFQWTLSRSVDLTSVDSTTFFVKEDGASTSIPSVIGFSDQNRKISISPRTPLSNNTLHTIEMTSDVLDESGAPLQNPYSTAFTTFGPPALVLEALSPPSGTAGINVVISGTGFDADPDNNAVFFNDVQATVTEASDDYLNVVVPLTDEEALVQITVDTETSNPLLFRMLVPEIAITNEDLFAVPTDFSSHCLAFTPDGLFAYAICSQADMVVPIDVFELVTLPSIMVDKTPYAVVIHPDGSYAYVCNLYSQTVSVIDINSTSDRYHQVVETIGVGLFPYDLAISPDGNRLFVANLRGWYLSIIDTDSTSSTHHQEIATTELESPPRNLAITPDGEFVMVGTEDGYVIVDAIDHGVITNAKTGSASRSVTITPDGTLLIILTMDGEVKIVDLVPGHEYYHKVIVTVKKGSKTRSVTITPDGAFLYLIQEEDDLVLVVSLEAISSVGVIAEGPEAPPAGIIVTIVDTLTAGENPAFAGVDPSGSGALLIANEGDLSITAFLPPDPTGIMNLASINVTKFKRGAQITWNTNLEVGTSGYHILRSNHRDSGYERITSELIPAMSGQHGGEYQFTDQVLVPNRTYYYQLEEISRNLPRQIVGPIEFKYIAGFSLEQNYPNPFNPTTTIKFTIPHASQVNLSIYDVAGRLVRQLINGKKQANHYTIEWDGKNSQDQSVASGVYFYKITAGVHTATKKMVFLK